ncbi:MAG TPA: amidohydrolase family protein, partial [Gemmatimonadaceae bacterium]|nr:amidohydrolase family protein [Gemmatimonadaceae bacterium]
MQIRLLSQFARTAAFSLLTLAPVVLETQQPAAYDLIIRNGRVLDGSGNPWFRADIGVTGDRIVTVGDVGTATGKRVIDAAGLYVAPGFIDVHSHAGSGLATAKLAHGQPLLAQGITTIFANPDGGGPVNLVRQKADLQKNSIGVNVALMVPHGSVRS